MGKIRKLTSKCIGVMMALAIFIAAAAGTAAARDLVPMGATVGIRLHSNGVVVIGVPDTVSDGITPSPAKSAGFQVGDVILTIGKTPINVKEDLKALMKRADGSSIEVCINRGGAAVTIAVSPAKSAAGEMELGLWLRDGISGIGTLTFYDPESGLFGALGHAVNDSDTGKMFPMSGGEISRSAVTDVIVGQAGAPGQLRGEFSQEEVLGRLTLNSPYGIFGSMEKPGARYAAIPAADDGEIKPGPAVILSNVSESAVREYAVEITRVYTGAEADGRSMMIKITDPGLIAQTGGIVQGMSGSPIIQNGKLVGAVTHVLINDPTRGYGISISKMLSAVTAVRGEKAA